MTIDERRIATRSICGALTSMPSTAQNSATASAASRTSGGLAGVGAPCLLLLPGRGTELREIVLQKLDEARVLDEVAALEGVLRLVVVVGGLLHELRDRLRWPRRRRRRTGRTWRGARGGRRSRRRRRTRPEERLQGLSERVGHHDPVLRREDEPLQLGDLALRGLDEQRLDIQERAAHRKHEEVATDALRPTARWAEQRELLADGAVIVDASFDLQRAEDGAVLREP